MSIVPISAALWMGIMTAVSPCPLATNIAAISFIGRQVNSPRRILGAGLFYTLGRMLSYLLLALLISGGLLATAEISRFLQKYMNLIIGPVMILLGMILLGWIGSGLSWSIDTEKFRQRAADGNPAWSFVLGVLFALSFCPVSAGLFFAGLIPLAVKEHSVLLMPALFGVGTAIPVIIFAFLIAFATRRVGAAFNFMTKADKWIRIGTGSVFILAGLYYSLTHVYGLHL